MCEFCHKHGEGKKWYLQAKNYSEDFLNDIKRRKFVGDFLSHPEKLNQSLVQVGGIQRLPSFVGAVLTPFLANRQKRVHFGQVVPIEDIEQIFSFVNSIVRVACICRKAKLGSEQRYCYGISMAPQEGKFAQIVREIDADYLTGPDTMGLEQLTKEEALASFRQHEKEGLCHTVWTFHTPFIGGICNCDRSDCLAMRLTVTHGFPVMFRAEYVAEPNPELCNGCRQCMRVCQFGAISYSAASEKIAIDPLRCYGCGICRANCTKNAILLQERSTIPVASSLW